MTSAPLNLFDSPPFDNACDSLRGFLQSQGYPDTVRWIWRESIISRRAPGTRRSANRRIFVDASRFASEPDIRRYYAFGVAQRRGLALRVLCLGSEIPCCYVDVPKDEVTAEYAMMTALNLSIPSPLPTATLIPSKWIASLLRLVIRPPSDSWIASEVPLRPIDR